jgi:hypothetical protein
MLLKQRPELLNEFLVLLIPFLTKECLPQKIVAYAALGSLVEHLEGKIEQLRTLLDHLLRGLGDSSVPIQVCVLRALGSLAAMRGEEVSL